MKELTFKISDNQTDIHEIERLRCITCYNRENVNSSYYIEKFYSNNLLIITAYLNKEIVGAMYLLNKDYHLVVDQLFVINEMKFSNLNIEAELLKQVEKNKDYIQEYFNSKFYSSIIDVTSKKEEQSYRNCGYDNTHLSGKLYKHL